GDRAPDVGPPGGRPFVRQLSHRGRRGDGIDRDHLAQAVCDGRGGLVPVDREGAACHVVPSAWAELHNLRQGRSPWVARWAARQAASFARGTWGGAYFAQRPLDRCTASGFSVSPPAAVAARPAPGGCVRRRWWRPRGGSGWG